MAFERLKDFSRRVRRLFSNSFMKSIAEVAQHESVTSDRMMSAIEEWLDMYLGNAPWLSGNPQSLGLPAIIASEVARTVTLEMDIKVTGSQMADFIAEQVKSVMNNIQTDTEYACAAGGIVFKPYVNGDRITTEIVQANAFYPIAFNDQKITGAYFIYRQWEGRKVYSRLERHELKGTTYTITNRAFVSSVDDALGKECSLTDVVDWAEISPKVVLQNVDSPLFAYFKIPIGNTIDARSPLGVSVYSRAVGLIADADEQYQRLMWEYKGGELAIDAASEVFKCVDGIPVLPEGKERLFRMNNLDAATTKGESLMKAWAPALRDENLIRGLNRLLIQIEDACCLSRGTLSDPSEVAKTSTEIKIMKQRSYSLISGIQESLEAALDGLCYAIYCLAYLYELCPDGEYITNYTFDDSVITDSEIERVRDQTEVAQGLMMKWEYRVKWYGEDEVTAKRMLEQEKDLTDEQLLGFNEEPEMNGDEGASQGEKTMGKQ